jgi:hypothetical protein
MVQQGGLDLAQLDPETAQLDLEIIAADILQLSAVGDPDQVTGSI